MVSITKWLWAPLIGFAVYTAAGQGRAESNRLKPSLTLQTGVASTFQLTLGSTFGKGPAWQNRVLMDFGHIALNGDAIVFNGWTTIDAPSHRRDWSTSVG